MCLDMYIYETLQNNVIKNGTDLVTSDFIINDELQCFYYWRSHPDLHAWFQQQFLNKLEEEHKNKYDPVVWVVELTQSDMQLLKQDIILNRLPQCKSCWFYNSTLKDKADTFYFIHAAEDLWNRQKNKDGLKTLVYFGYWQCVCVCVCVLHKY